MTERHTVGEAESNAEDTTGKPFPSDPSNNISVSQWTDWIQSSVNIRSIAMIGLFFYSTFFVVYIAKAILLPVVVALILNLLLAPIMRGLKKICIPAPLAAGGILALLAISLVIGLVQLSSPAAYWLDRAPEALEQVERKIQTVKRSVFEMGKATQALEKMTSLPETRKTQEVEVRTTSLGGALVGWTTEFIVSLVSTMVLLYFFLPPAICFSKNW